MKYIKKCVVLGLLMVLTNSVFAWNPPIIQCIKPFLSNNVPCLHIDWESNPDCMHFNVYYFYVNGNLSDSLFATSFSGGNLYYQGGKNITNVPTASQYNCYIVAVDSNDISCQSNTLQSITLTVTPNASRTAANIVWESPTTTFDNTWGSTFNIYKKRSFETNFPTQPFVSIPVSQLSYTDLSDVCNASISYQVGISHFYMDGSTQVQCPFMTTIGTVTSMVDSTNPAVPILDSVTVTPDNYVRLGFHTTEPYMKAIVIYRECPPPSPWPPYDTVYNIGNGYATWTDPSVDPDNVSFNYRIAAMDSCGNIGPMIDETNNKQHNIILYQDGFNSCRRYDTIHWTPYQNLINGINHYEIMLSRDNGATWENIGSTTDNNYMIEDLETNHNYAAYVRVVNNDATITASTNRIHFNIPPSTSNDFSYVRSVSVIDDMYIQIKVLTSGDTLPFKTLTLQRSENGTDFEDFRTFNHQQNTADYVFRDSLANFDQKTYYYRTFIVNRCDDTIYSNISHNILLEGENNAQANHLLWSSYDNWDGGVSEYYVLRKQENEPLFNSITDVSPAFLNEYSDDISSLFESGSKFVYYIKATENTNRYGFEETSYSNHITVIQPPTVYLSNAFRPMSSGDNNVFRPISSFVTPDQYRFSIYTRTGECIFFTTDPQDGWDGRKNGVIVPMDVYIYYIEYKMPDGTITKLPGTVTVIK